MNVRRSFGDTTINKLISDIDGEALQRELTVKDSFMIRITLFTAVQAA